MSCCFNPVCRKPFGFLSTKKKCLICAQKYCKLCFQPSQTKGRSGGYCNNCYTTKNPDNISYPEQFGSTLLPDSIYKQCMADKIKVNHVDPNTRYREKTKIGEGEYANVFLVKNNQNEIFALKVMKEKLSTATTILEEVNYTYNSICGNIVKCLEVYCYKQTYSMVMEFMDKNLAQVKQDIKTGLEINLISYIIREIIKGVEYLHSSFVIHRDLKPENIFINRKGEVKIGDLGICAQLTRERDLRTTFAGSPLWTAPEIICGQRYGKNCDIWSIGIIFQELIDGMPYFHKCKSLNELVKRLKSGEIPKIAKSCPNEVQEFLNSCCNYDPDQRLSAESLLQLPLLTNIDEYAAKNSFMNFYGYEPQIQPLFQSTPPKYKEANCLDTSPTEITERNSISKTNLDFK